MRLFGPIADELIDWFAPATSYDAGCSTGLLVGALAERGVDAHGGDISAAALAGAPTGLAERLEVQDLSEPLEQHYDLITCIEVLQYMSAGDAQLAVSNMCAAADIIVLSAAPDNFDDPSHVTVRSPAQWAIDLARRGFFRRTDVDASFITPWAAVFERRRSTLVEMVGAYEAMLAPITREVVAKRTMLLEAQRSPVAQPSAVDEPTAPLSDERISRLAMADEILGLRAELAEVRVHTETSVLAAGRTSVRLRAMVEDIRSELVRTQTDLTEARGVVTEMRASATWRIGRWALLPVRLARLPGRVVRGLSRRLAIRRTR